MNDKNMLELLDIYSEMLEKQDEIIYRMSHLLKEYATEIEHLRNINDITQVPESQIQDKAILNDCLHEYEDLKGLD